jgi:hypothetical protein
MAADSGGVATDGVVGAEASGDSNCAALRFGTRPCIIFQRDLNGSMELASSAGAASLVEAEARAEGAEAEATFKDGTVIVGRLSGVDRGWTDGLLAFPLDLILRLAIPMSRPFLVRFFTRLRNFITRSKITSATMSD